jgi:hypothetical protein
MVVLTSAAAVAVALIVLRHFGLWIVSRLDIQVMPRLYFFFVLLRQLILHICLQCIVLKMSML